MKHIEKSKDKELKAKDKELKAKDEELKASNQKINKLKIEVENLTEQLGDFLFSTNNEDETGSDSL